MPFPSGEVIMVGLKRFLGIPGYLFIGGIGGPKYRRLNQKLFEYKNYLPSTQPVGKSNSTES